MKSIRTWLSALAVVSLLCLLFVPLWSVTAAQQTDTSMTLHQVGNQLFNEKGQSVRLLGVNVPHYTWSLVGDNQAEKALEIALNDWQSNCIRLAVKPSFWLGLGSTSPDQATAYRARIDAIVDKVAAAGKYVILDNHSFYLPGKDSEDFWADAAVHYKNHPNVIFGLFNEPANCSWAQFYEGAVGYTYHGTNEWGQEDNIRLDSKGVPNLLKIVRAAGAKNIVTISGLTWGFDLEYMTEARFRQFVEDMAADMVDEKKLAADKKTAWVNDYVEKYGIRETTGNGIMFETHPYPEREDDWDIYLLDTLMKYPVVVGECGPTKLKDGVTRVLSDEEKSYMDKLTSYMDKYDMNLTAWALGAWPHLVQTSNYNKPSAYGQIIKDYISRNVAKKSVQLFTAQNFKGNNVAVEPGKYTVAELGFDMSKLASVSCRDDYYQYVVTFYEKQNQSGKSYSITPNVSAINVKDIGFTPASLLVERKIRENILPGHSTATANGSVDGNTPDRAIDGKTSSYWMNRSNSYSEIVIKLDAVYALNGITLYHAAEAGMMASDNSRSYSVSLSTNGKVYTRVADVKNNGLGLTSYYFDQTPAQYIRVQIRQGGLIEPDVAYLAEVMAYGFRYEGAVPALPGKIKTSGGNTDPIYDPGKTDVSDTGDSDPTDEPAEDPGSETDPTDPSGEDDPERTYYKDKKGNIYYIDTNGDKVLVDENCHEIGRIPNGYDTNEKDPTAPASQNAVVWPYIVGGVGLLIGIVCIVLALILIFKKNKSG